MNISTKITFFAITIFMVSACDYLPTSENKAKKAVAGNLIDPDSAKFENVFKGISEGSYCGFVNAKNRMGGYAGLSPFTYNGKTERAFVISKLPEREDFKSLYYLLKNKSSRFNEKFTEIYSRCEFPKEWKEICGIEFPYQANEICDVMLNKSDLLYETLKDEFK